MPALIASGRRGHASMSAASSGAMLRIAEVSAPDSALPRPRCAVCSGEFGGGSIPIHSRLLGVRPQNGGRAVIADRAPRPAFADRALTPSHPLPVARGHHLPLLLLLILPATR